MPWTIQYMICGLRILVRGEMYYMTLIVMKLDLLQVVLVVGQVHGVLEDPLIAGRRLLAWGVGDYLHGALLEVLDLFPHLEDGEEDLQGSGDHQEELPGHPHRMEQTNRCSLYNTKYMQHIILFQGDNNLAKILSMSAPPPPPPPS